MRSVQRIGNLHPTLQRLFERQRPFFESLRQRLAFDALHHQELDAVLSSNVVQHANVRDDRTFESERGSLRVLLCLKIES
jgi:hypothetical protein